jgi:hypothetical protein
VGVTVAVTRVAANTSTGIQSITTTDLGGLTPKAVLLIATRGVTDGAAVDGAGWYMGASDGANEWTQGYEDQHAQASMNTAEEQDTTANRILTIYNGTASDAVEGTANFSAFIADGVEIDWTDAPASAFLITAVFFAGSDLSAHVGTVSLGNTADALIAVTSVGFEADVLITALLEGTTTLAANVGLGLVHNDRAGAITQRSVAHTQRDGFGTSQAGVQYRDGEGLVRLIGTNQTTDFFGAFQSFDSSGFDVQMGNARAPGNTHLGWLALRLGASPAVSAKVYTLSTPTGTGSATDAGAGFEPQFVMYLAQRAAAADTSETDADGGSLGVVLVDGDEQYTQSIGTEDNAADSNTQSLSNNQLTLPTHTGAAAHAATFTSFGATGVTWNWTATDATARLWPALAIGINAGGGTTYNEAPSGAITPAGVVVLRTAKPLAGTLTSAGTLLLRAAKVLSGTLTSAGVALLRTGKVLGGAITPSGVVTAIKTALVAVGGTLTSAGTLLARANKTLSGAITPAGGLVLSARKVLEGTLTSAGTLANRIAKVLAGAITPSGVVNAIKTALVSVGGTLTSAGVLVLQTGKALGGTLAPEGSVLRAVSKLMSGTLTSAGDVLKRLARALGGTLTSSGTLAAVLSGAVAFIAPGTRDRRRASGRGEYLSDAPGRQKAPGRDDLKAEG